MVRYKNRYIVIEIENPSSKGLQPLPLRPGSLHYAIMTEIQQLFGDFGIAAIRAGFMAKYCNEKTRIAVIRCRLGPHKFVASALPFIKTIEQKQVKINTLYIGATVKQCFMFIKTYQRRKFEQFCKLLKTDEEKMALKRELMNFDQVLDIT